MSASQHHRPDSQKSPQHRNEESPAADTHSIAGSTTSEDTIEIEALAQSLSAHASRLSQPSLARKITSIATNGTSDPNYEVDFEDETDRMNPKNWSLKYKAFGLAVLSYNTLIMCVDALCAYRESLQTGGLTDSFKRPVFNLVYFGNSRDRRRVRLLQYRRHLRIDLLPDWAGYRLHVHGAVERGIRPKAGFCGLPARLHRPDHPLRPG